MDNITPPYSADVEETLLACCMYEGISTGLSSEDFYQPKARLVNQVISDLYASGTPVDVTTVADALSSRRQLDEVGGFVYLSHLLEMGINSPNIEIYRRVLKGKSNLRRILFQCNETLSQLQNGRIEDVDQFICDWQAKCIDACKVATDATISLAETLKTVVTDVEARVKDHSLCVGLSTGYQAVDTIMGGLKASSLYIVAGRPSMGKTALGVCIARRVAMKNKKVLIFEYEMSREQLVVRLIGMHARVDTTKIESGFLSRDEQVKVLTAAGEMSVLPILINDDNSVTETEMQHIVRKEKPDLVIVDHISLVPTSSRHENQNLKLGSITKAGKNMAKTMKIPVMMLCQLNRKVEERADKRPLLSDLRDSGEIEQDADCVVLMYRDEYYNRNSLERGIAEVNIGKNRMGRVGMVKLAWIAPYTLFEPLAYGAPDEQR